MMMISSKRSTTLSTTLSSSLCWRCIVLWLTCANAVMKTSLAFSVVPVVVKQMSTTTTTTTNKCLTRTTTTTFKTRPSNAFSTALSLFKEEDLAGIVGGGGVSTNSFRRIRKRDMIRYKLHGKNSQPSKKHQRQQQQQKNKKSWARFAKNNDDDDNTDDTNTDDSANNKKSLASDMKGKWETSITVVKERWNGWLETNNNNSIVLAIKEFLKTISETLTQLRYLLIGFTAGAMLAGAAILVPIYSQVESLSQPVALFETILGDLEQAYVDPVDTNKLFETGVAAMLRSLDPYTEFEGPQQAMELNESIDGKYGGVGLVIAGTPAKMKEKFVSTSSSTTTTTSPPTTTTTPSKPNSNTDKQTSPTTHTTPPTNGDIRSVSPYSITSEDEKVINNENDDDDDDDLDYDYREAQRRLKRAQREGIRVVSAFEGYAFDYGMRVGDKLLAVDDYKIDSDSTVEDVRNRLRGEPGTYVTLAFERDGVEGIQSVTMPRTVVRIRDVKLATLLGRPQDGIGYIQLSGFASEAGREMRNAITYLQRATEEVTNGEKSLQGLILDMRGNPGGLLTSAVDVASLLVPKGSDIVSAKGRGFPGILYRSRVDPILDPSTKLVVLVNGNTASAAEIVSGAVQDLDVGVIIGSDRTFGKGLVQNVEELPFNTALKFTVAKYYTPSGRCIQGINYSEGGGRDPEDGMYKATKVADNERSVFYTRNGRVVRDGGGIEADYKVEAPKASALEVTLLRSGVLSDYAAEWSKHHELTSNFEVDEDTYKNFQAYVSKKQLSGDLELEALYSQPLIALKKALKRSGYKGSEKAVEQLQASIIQEMKKDFDKYRSDIKEDISQSILARYLPDSMLIERGVKTDKQVQAAVNLIASSNGKFDTLLARGNSNNNNNGPAGSSLNVASGNQHESDTGGARASIQW